MTNRVTHRFLYALTVLAVSLMFAGSGFGQADQPKAKPAKAQPAGGMIYKFVNKTGGKFTDDQCFWTTNGGGIWHSFAKEPTTPCAGNGRVYFYVGDKKPRNFGDFSTYWDFIEYNYGGGRWYGNTTQVDAFCIPITIQLGDMKYGIEGNRAKLFKEFRDTCPKEFKGCVKDDLWIVSPCRAGFDKSGPYGNYFDKYVDEVWAMYAKEKKTPSGKYIGKVENGALTFTPVDAGPKAKTFKCARKPNTQEILLGTGVVGGDPAFCAAFNRHVAADPGDWRDASKFYQAEPCNWYSKLLHKYCIDHRCYGFCYDDYAEQAAYFAGEGPELIVTLFWDAPPAKEKQK